ncbi:MAG: gamma-glutamylcyclotransferase [Paracoccaceae bacterium]
MSGGDPGYDETAKMLAETAMGLALDKDAQATCDGLALRAAPGTEADTLAYLRERELVSAAYLERILPITLQDGRSVDAVIYVIDPDHVQYCGGLGLEDQAQIIAQAVGGRGPNTEYLFNTADHLEKMGIEDTELRWLRARVANLTE